MIVGVPTPLNVTQHYHASPVEVFALFNDPDFISGRLDDTGAPDSEVVTVDSTEHGVKIVTRQSIPSSVLPSMVASMIPGDPATERTEDWRGGGDGHPPDFSFGGEGGPGPLQGALKLAPGGGGSSWV